MPSSAFSVVPIFVADIKRPHREEAEKIMSATYWLNQWKPSPSSAEYGDWLSKYVDQADEFLSLLNHSSEFRKSVRGASLPALTLLFCAERELSAQEERDLEAEAFDTPSPALIKRALALFQSKRGWKWTHNPDWKPVSPATIWGQNATAIGKIA